MKPSILVYKQKRKTLVMKRTPMGLVLFIPKWMKATDPQVRAFTQEAIRKLGVPENRETVCTPEQLRDMAHTWAARLQVQPTRISVRSMFRKWGSCSSKGTITLNVALCSIPLPLAEYIVLHEIAHLREFNHGKPFKHLLDAHMPDWREREDALKSYL